MTEHERIREQVKRILTKFEGTAFYPYSSSVVGALSRELLALDGIEIRADDQSLPEMKDSYIFAPVDATHILTQQDFLKLDKEGRVWKKVISKEEYGS